MLRKHAFFGGHWLGKETQYRPQTRFWFSVAWIFKIDCVLRIICLPKIVVAYGQIMLQSFAHFIYIFHIVTSLSLRLIRLFYMFYPFVHII